MKKFLILCMLLFVGCDHNNTEKNDNNTSKQKHSGIILGNIFFVQPIPKR